MSETGPYFTPAAPPAGGPTEEDLAAQVAAGQAAAPSGVTSVDPEALLAMITGLQAQVDSLMAEKAAGSAVPVQAAAQALRDLVQAHSVHHPAASHGDTLRLADDAVDAASHAIASGDGSQVHVIAGRLARALRRTDPGPGDHHWYRQALSFAEVHLPDAADQLVPKRGAVAADVAPAGAIAGSVVG